MNHDDDARNRVVIPFRLPKAQYDELVGEQEHRLRKHKYRLRECAPRATRLVDMLKAGNVDLQAFVFEAVQAIADLEISVYLLEQKLDDRQRPE